MDDNSVYTTYTSYTLMQNESELNCWCLDACVHYILCCFCFCYEDEDED